MIFYGLLATLTLSSCVSMPRIARSAPAPSFDAFSFFSGRTLGTGRLKTILSGVEQTEVHGSGRMDDGTLVLDQIVREGTKPARHRTWHIRQDSPSRYSGTLTDASGPIIGYADGNRLHLAFTMKGGLPTEQWLTVAADGRSAHNLMIVKKFGLCVAVLDEDIRKVE